LSFSKHASTDKSIVIKHHPIDRGRVDYSKFIADLSQELNIANRVKVVHEYIESIEILTDALNRAKAYQPQLENFANKMVEQIAAINTP
jgi:hypothetical protein